MDKIINWSIFAHPINWLILFLMVFIFGIGLHFVLSHLTGGPPPQPQQ